MQTMLLQAEQYKLNSEEVIWRAVTVQTQNTQGTL